MYILFIIFFVAPAFAASDVPSLRDLALVTVAKNQQQLADTIEAQPPAIQQEIRDYLQSLDETLVSLVRSHLINVEAIVSILKDGAKPQLEDLLVVVASARHALWSDYFAPQEIYQRTKVVIQELHNAGAPCHPETLFTAMRADNKEAFELLADCYFAHGTWKKIRAKNGFTLFHYAARTAQREDFLEWLFTNHAQKELLFNRDNTEDCDVLSLLAADHNNSTKQRLLKEYRRMYLC